MAILFAAIYAISQYTLEYISMVYCESVNTLKECIKTNYRELDQTPDDFSEIARNHTTNYEQIVVVPQESKEAVSSIPSKSTVSFEDVEENKPRVSKIEGTSSESLYNELLEFTIHTENENAESRSDQSTQNKGIDDFIMEPPPETEAFYGDPNELSRMDQRNGCLQHLIAYEEEEEKKMDAKLQEIEAIEKEIAYLQSSDEPEAHKKSVMLLLKKFEIQGRLRERIELKKKYPEYFSVKPTQNNLEEPRIQVIGAREEVPLHLPLPPKSKQINKIADGIKGEQYWYGMVVGKDRENGSYIHFRDSSRREWIKVGNKKCESLEIGDILVMKVVVSTQKIRVLSIVKWKKSQEVRKMA